uniref:Uncharacterized protein n=1 Tax=Arundo donax TaxID=35708 RepID=A0A0A9EIF9_ARUDO
MRDCSSCCSPITRVIYVIVVSTQNALSKIDTFCQRLEINMKIVF